MRHGGNLIAFSRMNGASAVSATVAQGKAAASAGFGRASGACRPTRRLSRPSSPPWVVGCYPPGAQCLSTKRGNSLGPLGRAAPPLNRTSNVPRLGPLLSRLPGITGGFFPSTGLCSGVIGGATSIFAPPLIRYLTALHVAQWLQDCQPFGPCPRIAYQVP